MRIEPSRSRLTPFLGAVSVVLLLLGSTLSYGAGSAARIPGYACALVGVLGMAVFVPWTQRSRTLILLTSCALLCVTCVGLVAAPRITLDEAVQALLYPIAQCILLLTGYYAFTKHRRAAIATLWTLAALNAMIAVVNSLWGPFTIPGIGFLKHGRAIFGTSIPSSTGFMFNVNYFATFQGAVFWMLLGLKGRSDSDKAGALGLGAVLVSTLLGSSRGVTLALLVSGGVFLLIRSNRFVQHLRSIGIVAICLTAIMYVLANYYDAVAEVFRLYKGLNSRDQIWAAAGSMIMERPFIGWGGHEWLGEQLLLYGSTNSSAQSTYIMYLLRVGVIGFALVGILVAAAFRGITRPEFRSEHAWAYSLIVYWLVNSTVRTYTLGGLGAIPVLAAVALSFVLSTPLRQSTGTPIGTRNFAYSAA